MQATVHRAAARNSRADLFGRKNFAAEALHQAFEGAHAVVVNFGNNNSATWADCAGDVAGEFCEITLNIEIGGIADQRSAGSHDRRSKRTGKQPSERTDQSAGRGPAVAFLGDFLNRQLSLKSLATAVEAARLTLRSECSFLRARIASSVFASSENLKTTNQFMGSLPDVGQRSCNL